VEQPPYSPDLAVNDFWLFPRIKPALKEQRFQDIEDIKKKKKKRRHKAILQQKFQKIFPTSFS
jgi:hypothetical protein